MAQGRVDIILKAIDDYSGVLTGLNQGFELTKNVLGTLQSAAGLAFSAVKTGAEMAFKGVEEAVNLAVKGGDFQEMYNQLGNVAKAFEVDADSVIAILDDLTDNVISMTDSVKLASKGIAAGFNQDELEAVFTFAKRRTEATGESFEMMAEQIINAMQKGRYTTLSDMGLMIEKGMDTAGILKEIERATAQYGDTGYNTGDKIGSLTNQMDKFQTKVGQAINQSWAWETVINLVQDGVIGFVNSLDYSAVTRFFNGVLAGFTNLMGGLDFDAIVGKVSGMLNAIADAVNTSGFQAGMRNVTGTMQTAFDYLLSIDYASMFKSFASGTESLIKGISGAILRLVELEREYKILSEVAKAVGDFVSAAFYGISEVTTAVVFGVRNLSSWLGELSVDAPIAIAETFFRMQKYVADTTFELRRMLGLLEDTQSMTFDVGDTWSERYKEDIAKQHLTTQSDAKNIGDMLSQANWPAEFQALGDFMFKWVLSAASGSLIPMAITTAR